MRELNERGAEWGVVTQGSEPVWASGRNRLLRLATPRVEVVNPIGSGDCLAAGIAWGLALGHETVAALQLGIAAAVENVTHLLPGRLDSERVQARAGTIQVEAV